MTGPGGDPLCNDLIQAGKYPGRPGFQQFHIAFPVPGSGPGDLIDGTDQGPEIRGHLEPADQAGPSAVQGLVKRSEKKQGEPVPPKLLHGIAEP
jgi:hypothetical protein